MRGSEAHGEEDLLVGMGNGYKKGQEVWYACRMSKAETCCSNSNSWNSRPGTKVLPVMMGVWHVTCPVVGCS